jgi:hypothetical protein
VAEQLRKNTFEWRHVAECPGSPPTREVAVQLTGFKHWTVFRISGAVAEEMRMVSISSEISPGCHEIDIRNDLSSVLEEPAFLQC